MVPIDKGAIPQLNNMDVVVTNYKNWRRYLIERLGPFCSYCNMPLHYSPQVEHVNAINPPLGFHSGSRLEWDNVLLACSRCNLGKTNTPFNTLEFYYPHFHNTLMAFMIYQPSVYSPQLLVGPKENLSLEQTAQANRTINMLDLDVVDERDNVSDLRSLFRLKAYESATALLEMVETSISAGIYDVNRYPSLIVDAYFSHGYFLVFYQVFIDYPVILNELFNRIKGFHLPSYNYGENLLVPRNPINIDNPI